MIQLNRQEANPYYNVPGTAGPAVQVGKQDANPYYNVTSTVDVAKGDQINPYAHINLEEIHVPLESEKKYEQLKF